MKSVLSYGEQRSEVSGLREILPADVLHTTWSRSTSLVAIQPNHVLQLDILLQICKMTSKDHLPRLASVSLRALVAA